jgi:hypothetical protein
MGARNRVGTGLSYCIPVRQASQPVGMGSLESFLELLKSLKIRALRDEIVCGRDTVTLLFFSGGWAQGKVLKIIEKDFFTC